MVNYAVLYVHYRVTGTVQSLTDTIQCVVPNPTSTYPKCHSWLPGIKSLDLFGKLKTLVPDVRNGASHYLMFFSFDCRIIYNYKTNVKAILCFASKKYRNITLRAPANCQTVRFFKI